MTSPTPWRKISNDEGVFIYDNEFGEVASFLTEENADLILKLVNGSDGK